MMKAVPIRLKLAASNGIFKLALDTGPPASRRKGARGISDALPSIPTPSFSGSRGQDLDGARPNTTPPPVVPPHINHDDGNNGDAAANPSCDASSSASTNSEFYCPFQRKVFCRHRHLDYYRLLQEYGFQQDLTGNTYSIAIGNPGALVEKLAQLHAAATRALTSPTKKKHKVDLVNRASVATTQTSDPNAPTATLRVAVSISLMQSLPSIGAQQVRHLDHKPSPLRSPPTSAGDIRGEVLRLNATLLTIAKEAVKHLRGTGNATKTCDSDLFKQYLQSEKGVRVLGEFVNDFLVSGRLRELNRVRAVDARKKRDRDQSGQHAPKANVAPSHLPPSLVDAVLGGTSDSSISNDGERRELAASIIRSDQRLQAPNVFFGSQDPPSTTTSTEGEGVELTSLNTQQKAVLHLAQQGHSMYIGGNAGTGKSFLLRAIIDSLRGEGFNLQVAVTASTGIAGLNIGGSTFHSFFQVSKGGSRVTTFMNAWHKSVAGPGHVAPPSKHSVSKIASQFKPSVLRALDVIIVDEVSMLPTDFLVALSMAAKRARLSSLPFGGIQVVMSGDFLQLKCIDRDEGAHMHQGLNSTAADETSKIKQCDSHQLFHCPVFSDGVIHLKLTEVMRQASDKEFLAAINELRVGKLTPLIANSARLNPPDDNAIMLFPCKREVAEHNDFRMQAIDAPWVTFETVLDTKPLPGSFSDTATFFLPKSPVSCHRIGSLPTTNERLSALRRLFSQQLETPLSNIFVLSLGKYPRVTQNEDGLIVTDMDYQYAVRTRLPPRNSPVMQSVKSLAFAHNAAGVEGTSISPSNLQLSSVLEKFASEGTLSEIHMHSHAIERAKMDRQSRSLVAFKSLVDIERDIASGHKLLKLGSRVMLLKNLTPTLVNGRSGTIVRFSLLNLSDPAFKPIRSMYRCIRVPPPKSGHAQTFDDVFTMFPASNTIAHERCLSIELPVVRFDDGIESYIPYIRMPLPGLGSDSLEANVAKGHQKNAFSFSVSIATMPLVPAYAFTVHKVQGLTIDGPMVVDCRRMWQCDHLVYVAASRVKKREHLRVIGLQEHMISVDSAALKFASERCKPVEEAIAELTHNSHLFPSADWALL